MKMLTIKIISLILALFVFVSAFCGCSVQKETHNSKVYVQSEFAPLKRAVLSQSEMTFPDLTDDDCWARLDQIGLTDADRQMLVEYLSEPEAFKKEWEAEREGLKSVLLKYGVEVLEPRHLTDKEIEIGCVENGFTNGTGATNFFSRDPFFTVGEHIIEGQFRSPYRRLEVLPIRDILDKETSENGAYHVSVPMIDVSDGVMSEKGPYLEGGDVLVYNKTVFVGNSGNASNEAGIKWLSDYLKHFGYKVTEVKLAPEILHLDCALSLVKEGLMVVCEEAFINGLPKELKNWDKITVNKEDAINLATNGLPINEKVYITDIAFKNTVGAELEKRGITVEYLDFKISRSLYGAFRCSAQPLLRCE